MTSKKFEPSLVPNFPGTERMNVIRQKFHNANHRRRNIVKRYGRIAAAFEPLKKKRILIIG